ncbi:MAG: nickel pincer cofactor-dependent isomerase, group 22 [Acidimicrobiales bacterium]
MGVLVGSRGIAGIGDIVTGLVRLLAGRGARVVLIPAMGSHGDGTSAGQIRVLRTLGIDEDALPCVIDASMDVEEIGRLRCGAPVYTAVSALSCDVIIPVNRVKPHSDFRGPVESGLVKMLAVGLGKVQGASSLHAVGFDRFFEVLPEAAQMVIDRIEVPFGVALVENSWHQLCEVEAVPGEEILEREKKLLALALEQLGVLPFPNLDILVLREMGKDISGAGIDPNVSGRWAGMDLGGGASVGRLAVLDLTEASAGNASGVGLADIVTERLRTKIDWQATYLNAITSKSLGGCRLPLVAKNDRDALEIALASVFGLDLSHPRFVGMRNTLEVNDLVVSPDLVGVAEEAGYLIEGFPARAEFDESGVLLSICGLEFFAAPGADLVMP